MKTSFKCEWYEHGEKSSKFFLNLKKDVLFKTKFEQLFIMTKKPMMKQKLISIFILFPIICIKKIIAF